MTTPPKPNKLRKFALIALGSIVLLYGIAVFGFKLMEDYLVYYPVLEVKTELPTKLGLDIDEISINSPDGETLAGWLTYADPAKAKGKWVIFLHGNASNVSTEHYLYRYRALSNIGLNVLAIDYHGFGKSTGRPSEQGLYQDGQTVYDYLRQIRKVSSDDIVIYGFSLGTGIAVELASRNHAGGLVLEAPYSSLPSAAAHQYPWLPVRLLMKNQYPTEDRIGKVNYPILILHATNDEIVHYTEGETVLAAATSQKSMVPLRGTHNTAAILDSAKFYGAFEAFVTSLR